MSVIARYAAAVPQRTRTRWKLSDEEMRAARDEFSNRWRQDYLQRHPEADKDHDGKLSDEEMKAVRDELSNRGARTICNVTPKPTRTATEVSDEEMQACVGAEGAAGRPPRLRSAAPAQELRPGAGVASVTSVTSDATEAQKKERPDRKPATSGGRRVTRGRNTSEIREHYKLDAAQRQNRQSFSGTSPPGAPSYWRAETGRESGRAGQGQGNEEGRRLTVRGVEDRLKQIPTSSQLSNDNAGGTTSKTS